MAENMDKDPLTGRFTKGNKLGGNGRGARGLAADILKAYEKLGGIDYLVDLGTNQPKLFAMLLQRLVPKVEDLNINTDNEKTIVILPGKTSLDEFLAEPKQEEPKTKKTRTKKPKND